MTLALATGDVAVVGFATLLLFGGAWLFRHNRRPGTRNSNFAAMRTGIFQALGALMAFSGAVIIGAIILELIGAY